MSKWSTPVPQGCRRTSGFGRRWGTLHAGTDWAPPKPGQMGIPIYAIHDATIIATGNGRGRAGDRIPYHSGKFVWYDIGWHGGDRMRIYAGHLDSIAVKPGQKVKAGQVIGYMGASGNVTGVHLHLGVAQNHNRPVHAAQRLGAPGWINPEPWLRSKGIRVGSDSPVKLISASRATARKATATRTRAGMPSKGTIMRTAQPKVPIRSSRNSKSAKNIVGWAHNEGYRLELVKVSGSWAQIRWKGRNRWVNYYHLELLTGRLPINRVMRTKEPKVEIKADRSRSSETVGWAHNEGYRISVIERRGSWAKINWKGRERWTAWRHFV